MWYFYNPWADQWGTRLPPEPRTRSSSSSSSILFKTRLTGRLLMIISSAVLINGRIEESNMAYSISIARCRSPSLYVTALAARFAVWAYYYEKRVIFLHIEWLRFLTCTMPLILIAPKVRYLNSTSWTHHEGLWQKYTAGPRHAAYNLASFWSPQQF